MSVETIERDIKKFQDSDLPNLQESGDSFAQLWPTVQQVFNDDPDTELSPRRLQEMTDCTVKQALEFLLYLAGEGAKFLKMRFYFVDQEGIRYSLPYAEVNKVQEGKEFLHPTTKHPVQDPMNKIFFAFKKNG